MAELSQFTKSNLLGDITQMKRWIYERERRTAMEQHRNALDDQAEAERCLNVNMPGNEDQRRRCTRALLDAEIKAGLLGKTIQEITVRLKTLER